MRAYVYVCVSRLCVYVYARICVCVRVSVHVIVRVSTQAFFGWQSVFEMLEDRRETASRERRLEDVDGAPQRRHWRRFATRTFFFFESGVSEVLLYTLVVLTNTSLCMSFNEILLGS